MVFGVSDTFHFSMVNYPFDKYILLILKEKLMVKILRITALFFLMIPVLCGPVFAEKTTGEATGNKTIYNNLRAAFGNTVVVTEEKGLSYLDTIIRFIRERGTALIMVIIFSVFVYLGVRLGIAR